MDPSISAGIGGGVSSTYPDSLDSSPRSRGGESWDEPPYSSPKLRLMCSYGGRIVPRPTDKSLCYLGGDTRIVVVDRSSSLSSLSEKLSRSLLGGRPFSLKYQLPNEDLDSLISVTTDEDLENMIEEYDRIAAAASPNSAVGPTRRVRLFLFPSKPESAPSSIGSLLDDSKSETWFVDALNGAIGMGMDGLPRGLSTDSASVNCLLGLEDDSSVHSRAGPGGGGGGGGVGAPGGGVGGLQHPDPLLPRPDSSGKLTRQDIHSVPDSPMLDTTSSFGSASSAPSLSNLPPIRVRPDDRPPDPRYANIDDHFARMNLQSAAAVQRQEEAPKGPSAAPPVQTTPPPTASASTPPTISPTENPRPGAFGSEDDKPEARKLPISAAPNPKPVPVEAQMLDRPVYYQERIPTAAAAGNPIPDPKREIPDPEQTYRMQTVSAIPPPEQMHPHAHAHLLQQQQQQQQQQQFIHANPQYLQVPSYYQVPHPMQQTQPYDPQIPMYYLPVRQNPQAPPAAAVPMSKLPPKTEIAPTNIYRTMAPPPQMVHMAPPAATDQGQLYNHMGYRVMHHNHPSQTAQVANYGYEYANAVPTSAPDQLHPQMYYTQATSPPTMPAQYQTVVQDDNAKQNRGS
ncbi:putative leucine-rich repeat extensin-like protein 2 [Iris pallida]|uniref:Leucine-rich repeat extensin-like protein 2 n=1 Tax=Iris pallida TaxID=29817 RepID=A0AAX6DNS6_IRIPA|nr:putative leucine-rich repeat extensin-like protein 2 [Iris pallida]